MSSMVEYFLSKNACICECDGRAVILDLNRNRYFTLTLQDSAQLNSLLRLQATSGGIGSQALSPTALGELMQELEQGGVLVRDASEAQVFSHSVLERPQAGICDEDMRLPHLRWHHLFDFVVAWTTAVAMLRVLPIRSIVNRVRVRKEKMAATVAPPSRSEVQQVARVYAVVQSVFNQRPDTCLRRSLALVEFLSRCGVYPSWVFGVRLSPFAAHSWVQYSGVVLNDSPEHVRAYTPILVI
jgi:hypothetical protein